MQSADPSDIFLPDLAASADSDSKAYPFPTADSIAVTAPPAKKSRRCKDSTSNSSPAPFMSNRPPLAIRPAPPSFPMVQSPMMNMGSNQWGYQTPPGYVWGTPMGNPPTMDSSCAWQVCYFILHLFHEQPCVLYNSGIMLAQD